MCKSRSWSTRRCSGRCVALHGVALRCGALRCVALRCVVLRCVVLQGVIVRCSALQCAAVRCRASMCVAVRCSALQCVAVCCRVLQCVAVEIPGDVAECTRGTHFKGLLHSLRGKGTGVKVSPTRKLPIQQSVARRTLHELLLIFAPRHYFATQIARLHTRTAQQERTPSRSCASRRLTGAC